MRNERCAFFKKLIDFVPMNLRETLKDRHRNTARVGPPALSVSNGPSDDRTKEIKTIVEYKQTNKLK